MKKALIGIAVGAISLFGISTQSFASDSVQLEEQKTTISVVVDNVQDFLGDVADYIVPGADASFMGDIATDIGSGATAEVGEVIAGPIGSIIFYVLAITLIGFVVGTIAMWIRRRH